MFYLKILSITEKITDYLAQAGQQYAKTAFIVTAVNDGGYILGQKADVFLRQRIAF